MRSLHLVGSGAVRVYEPGVSPQALTPGDVVLSSGESHAAARAATLGQRRRFAGSPFARWTHAAVVVDSDLIVDMLLNGGAVSGIAHLHALEFAVVHVHPQIRGLTGSPASLEGASAAGKAMRRNAIDFALFTAGMPRASSWRQTRTFLELAADRPASAATAGSLVAHALGRLGFILPRKPNAMLPADLARFFGVQPWREGD